MITTKEFKKNLRVLCKLWKLCSTHKSRNEIFYDIMFFCYNNKNSWINIPNIRDTIESQLHDASKKNICSLINKRHLNFYLKFEYEMGFKKYCIGMNENGIRCRNVQSKHMFCKTHYIIKKPLINEICKVFYKDISIIIIQYC